MRKHISKSLQWLLGHALTIFSCVAIIALGMGAVAYSSTSTTIGENISTSGTLSVLSNSNLATTTISGGDLILNSDTIGVGTSNMPVRPDAPEASVTTPTNLVLNSGFETAGSPTFQNWSETGTGIFTNETSLVHNGGHAIKLSAGTSYNAPKIFSNSFSVSPSTVYYLSFWTRGDGSNPGMYYIRDVSHGTVIVNYTSTGISDTTYQQFTTSFTTPAGCSSIYIMFSLPTSLPHADENSPIRTSAPPVAYFDDVYVGTSQIAGEISDGTFYYSITAVNSSFETLLGEESSAVVVSGGASNSSIALTWNDVPEATSYKIYRTTSSGAYPTPSFIGSSDTNSYTDTSFSALAGTPPSSSQVGFANISPSGIIKSAGLLAPYIKPYTDSSSALQIQTSNGSALMSFDTLNGTAILNNSASGGSTNLTVSAGSNQGINPVATFDGNISLGGISSPSASTVAVGAAGSLTGTYYYWITYVNSNGETGMGTRSSAVNPSSQKVVLTNIPISSSASVVARNIYRTTANVLGDSYYYVATIPDNTTTTYTDNTTDGNLGYNAHYLSSSVSTSGGIYANGRRVFKEYGVGLTIGQNSGLHMTQWDNNLLVGSLAGDSVTTASYLTIIGA